MCDESWKYTWKHFCQNIMATLRKMMFVLQAELWAFLMEHNLYLRKWLTMIIQTWVFGREVFLKINKISLLLQEKSILENVDLPTWAWHLSILKTPLMRLLVLLTYVIFLILYKDHLKELHKSVNQLFPKRPMPMML